MPQQLGLLSIAERQREIADTSLIQWDRLKKLNGLDVRWFRLVCIYLEEKGHADVSGGELAEWACVAVTTSRPRLTMLKRKGWLEKGPQRASRVAYEGSCRGYRCAVPRAAVERMKK